MTKDEAEMWAKVARVIGLDVVVDNLWGWSVRYAYKEGPTIREFNPPANPADERMLWQYAEASPEFNNMFHDSKLERWTPVHGAFKPHIGEPTHWQPYRRPND